jgi:hypothetical protein
MADQRGRVTNIGAQAAPQLDIQSDAGALVAQGHALMRIENETMLSVAVQRPRNEAAIMKGALGELDLVPEEAARAYYSIPYKEKQPDGSVRVVKVEGPSIKAAMTLARRWGNCTTTARILNEDKEGFDLEGVFVDLETNFRVARPMRVGKFFKLRSGSVVLLDPKKQEMAIQSGASKAMRNAILAGVPPYLVAAYDKKARAIVGGGADAPAEKKTVDAVVAAFAKWKVTREHLETYEELPASAWTGTQIADLRGLWNSISDGQVTVDEVFFLAPTEQPGPSAPVTVTPDSLIGATVTGEDNHEPGDPRPDLLKAIAELRATLKLADAAFHAMCKEHAGTTVLEVADPAALDALLGALKAFGAKR